jgi:hypothetical protein
MNIICDIPKVFCNVRDLNSYCMLDKLCDKIVEQCVGCNRVENDYCKAFICPTTKWLTGDCALASHIVREAVEVKKVNPLKLSKKSSKK